MGSEKPVYAPFRFSEMFPTLPLNSSNVHLTDDGPLSSLQGRSSSASSFHASLLQAISGVMSLALCQQVVSQAPQHFRSSEAQATCGGCFARHSICSVISLDSVCPGQYIQRRFRRWMLTIDTYASRLSIPLIFLFIFKNILYQAH